MLTNEQEKLKKEILEIAGVTPMSRFDVKKAIRDRIDYLKNYVRKSGMKGIVLGISGGVDSTTAGSLSQIAMKELREEGYEAQFIAVRLPYKVQLDEEDAQEAVKFINADQIVDVNIGNGTDGIFNSVLSALYSSTMNEEKELATNDFVKGNVKARMRMIAQYAIAGKFGCLVLGTDHNAEFTAGFYTKHGDGACDLTVLNGLNKRQVRACAKELGAPEWLWSKVATADLEEDNPQVSDEIALGFKYDDMDDFLEGKEIEIEAEKRIIQQYKITIHKREMPVGFE
ncbi:MAG: NAD(+) synthase [Chloroflexi bacterium]|nr:NAD(+) synthase [Chloroflexota bacterium]